MENFQPLEILLTQFIEFLPKLITAIVIFIITLLVASWLSKLTAKAMKRRDLDAELILLSRRVVRITVLIFGTIQALAQLNFNVTGFRRIRGGHGFKIFTPLFRHAVRIFQPCFIPRLNVGCIAAK